MRLISTQFTLSTNSLDIYFGGCNGPHCKNCHNPESQPLDSGEIFQPHEIFEIILAKIIKFPTLIKNMMLFGGEPLDQPLAELEELLSYLNTIDIPIWLFTHYDIKEVPVTIRNKCEYIKTGRYLEEFLGNEKYFGITLASTNQKILRRGIDFIPHLEV